MVDTITVAPEVKQGRNQLATTVVLGHTVKHIFNSALRVSLLPSSRNAFAMAKPSPVEAPVTITVFVLVDIIDSLLLITVMKP